MKKKTYKQPKLTTIRIDNQISLVMLSKGNEDAPPQGPFGNIYKENNKTNPYKA